MEPSDRPHPASETKRPIAFVWTVEEAELAYREKRIEFNLARTIPEEAKRGCYRRDGFLVDGIPATIQVCCTESDKHAILKAEQLAREPEEHEKQKWVKFPSDPEPIQGRACALCGGKLVLAVHNYFRDEVTDVMTPADKVEKCLSCGTLFQR